VATWRITGGPREFRQTELAHDMDVGWAYDLDGPSGERPIRVIVSRTAAAVSDLPDVSRRAIQTQGRSAVEQCLDRVAPPRSIIVTTVGLSEKDE
jgi:hypothetical protein